MTRRDQWLPIGMMLGLACSPELGPDVNGPPAAMPDAGRPLSDAGSCAADGGRGGGGSGGNDVCSPCSQQRKLTTQVCPVAACDCSTGCCCCR